MHSYTKKCNLESQGTKTRLHTYRDTSFYLVHRVCIWSCSRYAKRSKSIVIYINVSPSAFSFDHSIIQPFLSCSFCQYEECASEREAGISSTFCAFPQVNMTRTAATTKEYRSKCEQPKMHSLTYTHTNKDICMHACVSNKDRKKRPKEGDKTKKRSNKNIISFNLFCFSLSLFHSVSWI